MKKMLLSLICLLPALASAADPNLHTVDCIDPAADFDCIQDAIDAANHGDTILVKPCTYNENIRFKGKAVTLTSKDPYIKSVVETTIIRAATGYAVSFDFGEGSGSIITGFTITGRGIYCNGTTPVITRNIISQSTNNAITGANDAAPFVSHNTITSNSPGGIYNCHGEISDNTINNNGNNGALYLCSGSISGNEISGNVSGGHGGAMYLCGGAITGNVIRNNTAAGNGGAIFVGAGAVTGNLIVGNKAGSLGGGLYARSGAIGHNIIAGNQAQYGGGGMDSCSGGIYSNTIVGNRSPACAAVSYCPGSITNNIIAYNEATDCGGICGSSSSSYNCFWENAGGHFCGASASTGDVECDPRFAEVGYWDPNGTPGNTGDDFWVDGDYHLLSEAGRWNPYIEMWVYDGVTSACIDAGDPNSAWKGEYWPHGGCINIGRDGNTAEASMSLKDDGNVADLNLDGLVDFWDLMLFGRKWSLREPLLREDLDRDGQVDFVDYAAFGPNWQPLPPPSPNPMTWKTEPAAISASAVTMTASDANSSDSSGVEYYFEETSGEAGGDDSAWQDSASYTDTGLSGGVNYCYKVKARNKGNKLETAPSEQRCAMTPVVPPPTPNPMTWSLPPTAISHDTIKMAAATATPGDGTSVEYYFDETSGNPGGTDSLWQPSPVYEDTGLTRQTTYCYRVKARNTGNSRETAWSDTRCATTLSPPNPNPMTWATAPYASSYSTITMQATAAASTDGTGVEYFFDETSGNPGGSDSAWQDSASHTDTGLSGGVNYCYKVKARNKGNKLETELSEQRCATTPVAPAPTPDPMAWLLPPAAISHDTIKMTAATATPGDGTSVEYYFDETSGNPGGTDSLWQPSPVYEDTGLTKQTTYCYRVKARNTGNLRETAWSDVRCATTPCDDSIAPYFPSPPGYWEYQPCECKHGSSEMTWYAEMTAGEAQDASGYVEYFFECVEDSSKSSGWRVCRHWEVLLGRSNQGFSFRVKARDACHNETAWSPAVLVRQCPGGTCPPDVCN